MIKLTQATQTQISDRMVEAAQIYLYNSGALEEPSLVLYHEFVQQMLEETFENCGEPWRAVTERMKQRAMDYALRNLDPDDPLEMTSTDYVHGLLNYALLGAGMPEGEKAREVRH